MQKPDVGAIWSELEKIIRDAGSAIIDVYNSDDHGIELKGDNSPISHADKASQEIIMSGLESLKPSLPIVSEELPDSENFKAISSPYYWCVDPLDGTAEFARHRDQFVVNIGLIGPDSPVAGMVYAPVHEELYWGEVGAGAWVNRKGKVKKLSVSKRIKPKFAVGSFSHLDSKTKDFIDSLGNVDVKQYGSALKFTAVASGKADIYPRFHPCSEWDTAAPHAIVLAAGGRIVDMKGKELDYRKPKLLNGEFVCYNGKIHLNIADIGLYL